MPILNTPFRKTNLKSKNDTFTVKFNDEERKEFEEFKKLLQQEKDSTAIKQLAQIGAKVLLNPTFAESNKIIMNNYRKNKRLGIVTFD